MKIPQIKFSKWFRWSDRTKIKNINAPGVYILAKFKKAPKGSADPINKNVVYIGETCDNSLEGRWYQFNRSAFQSKNGHSGGLTYNKNFGDKGDDLYVAAWSVPNPFNNLRHLFIRYIERRLILEFALKYKSQPKLNHK